jgi:hypothetical protein
VWPHVQTVSCDSVRPLFGRSLASVSHSDEVCFNVIGTMLDGVMANNVVGLAFGGGMQEMKKQGTCRTS